MTAEQARQLADSPEVKEQILFKRRIKQIYDLIENTVIQGRTNYITINLGYQEIEQLKSDGYIISANGVTNQFRVLW